MTLGEARRICVVGVMLIRRGGMLAGCCPMVSMRLSHSRYITPRFCLFGNRACCMQTIWELVGFDTMDISFCNSTSFLPQRDNFMRCVWIRVPLASGGGGCNSVSFKNLSFSFFSIMFFFAIIPYRALYKLWKCVLKRWGILLLIYLYKTLPGSSQTEKNHFLHNVHTEILIFLAVLINQSINQSINHYSCKCFLIYVIWNLFIGLDGAKVFLLMKTLFD